MTQIKRFYNDLKEAQKASITDAQRADDDHHAAFMAFCHFNWSHTRSGQHMPDNITSRSIAVCTLQ